MLLNHFIRASRAAANLERDRNWLAATHAWQKVGRMAGKHHQRHWAESRADFCSRRVPNE